MAALTRKYKKIFASSASNNGVFGSAAALAPATSNNPETIESLPAFLAGWDDATEGGIRLPCLEDLQALKYDTDYHLAYIYQNGMQVYNSQTTYYTNNLVREDATGKIWKSLIDDNTGNALVEGTNWTLFANLALTPSSALGTAAYVNTGTSVGNVPLIGTTSATTSLAGLSVLNDPIVMANNASSPNTTIDFSEGTFQFSDGSGQAIATAKSKILQTSGSWTEGTNQNGLFSGTRTSNTWYHCFAIYNPTTGVVDFGFDTSVIAANRPSGYTKYFLIESILTDSSNNIIYFIHYAKNTQNQILFRSPLSLSASCTTSASIHSIPTPANRTVNAQITAVVPDVGSGTYGINGFVTSLGDDDLAPSSTIFNIYSARTSSWFNNTIYSAPIRAVNSQIRSRFAFALGNIQITTYGWYK